MEENQTNDQLAEQAVDLGTLILKMCEESNVHENIAQAALGNSWFRLCFAMGFTPSQFQEMLLEVIVAYKKKWKEKNEDQVA